MTRREAALLLIVATMIGAVLAGMAARTVKAQGDSRAASGLVAQLSPQGPPQLTNVVRYRGRGVSAGLSHYRVADQSTVPAYSVSLEARPEAGAKLVSSDPASSAIVGLSRASLLGVCSAGERDLDAESAAAYQVAIWHFTDLLPVRASTVRNRRIRREALGLIRQAARAPTGPAGPEVCGQSQKFSQDGFGKASYGLAMQVRLSESTIGDQSIAILLTSGNVRSELESPQALQVRINGVATFVCSGSDTRIDTEQTFVGAPKPLSPPQRDREDLRPCGRVSGRSVQHRVTSIEPLATARLPDGGLAQLGQQAKVRIPRGAGPQRIDVFWSTTSDPGGLFLPRGRGAPIITAGHYTTVLSESVELDSDDLNRFGAYLQQTVVAFISGLGYFGLIPLVLLFIALVTATRWAEWVGYRLIVVPGRWLRRLWSGRRKSKSSAPDAGGSTPPTAGAREQADETPAE